MVLVKKRSLQDYGSRDSAPYVAMHGFLRIKRGHRPSMPFGGVKNPEEAFKTAVLAWFIMHYMQTSEHLKRLHPEVTYVERGAYGVEAWYYDFDMAVGTLQELGDLLSEGKLRFAGRELKYGRITFQTSFNGVIVRVRSESMLGLLKRDFTRVARGYTTNKVVGPYSKESLSEEELANDARIKAEREEKHQREIAEYEAKRQATYESNKAGREFDLGDILSVTTGCLVSRRHVDALYDLMGFMTTDTLYTHALIRASAECKPALLEQHPELADISFPEGLEGDDAVYAWLAEQETIYGTKLLVKPLPLTTHEVIDPITELADMVGPEKVMVVDISNVT